MKCITQAWDLYENELRCFLYNKTNSKAIAEDLIQEVFLKALAKKEDFCNLDNTRAWLYRVTKNLLIDYQRGYKSYLDIDEQHPETTFEQAPVVHLSKCLPVALKKLTKGDQHIITQCDLEGLSQIQYAQLNQLTLASTKSRIQRARKRLKQELHIACNIILDDNGHVCCFDPKCK